LASNQQCGVESGVFTLISEVHGDRGNCPDEKQAQRPESGLAMRHGVSALEKRE
jgi:hypothetical protein